MSQVEQVTGKGDCYVAAFHLMHHLAVTVPADELDQYRLCHGEVTGTGGDVVGVRYSHAWVEHTGPAPDWLPEGFEHLATLVSVNCIDKSNGNDVCFPRPVYYSLGQIDPDTVVRYTAHDAFVEGVTAGTYGPWHEDE